MSDSWRVEEADGLTLVRSGLLASVGAVAHAFSTRRADGGEDFDLGGAADRRRLRFLHAAGIAGTRPCLLRQVHGASVVTAHAGWEVPPEADAALWLPGSSGACVPSVRTADCVPILLVDRAGRGAAAVHAGWRGTAAGIALRAVEALAREGIGARGLVAALGPAIRPCCYEVGPEVAQAVALASGGRSEDRHLDLQLANLRQLVRAGVPERSIETAPWCTRCRPDLFFSHRRDPEGSGRMLASVGPSLTVSRP